MRALTWITISLWLAVQGCTQTLPRAADYDVVVVGGGLAGLSAAYALNDLRILLLEKEAQLGGRVHTEKVAGVAVDLGALFAFPDEALPFPFAGSPTAHEAGALGLWRDGRLVRGKDVASLLAGANLLPPQSAARLVDEPRRWAADPALYAVLNAFFQAVHPGEMNRSIFPRQRDAFTPWRYDHRVAGNQEVIAAYADRIKGEIRTAAEVTSVTDGGRWARVDYRHAGLLKSVTARAVIVTTPPRMARTIIHHPRRAAALFLDNVDFAAGAVAALVVREPARRDLRYVVSPQLPMNAVFISATTDATKTTLTLLYAGYRWLERQGRQDSDLVAEAEMALRSAGLLSSRSKVEKWAFRRWQDLGPIVSAKAYAGLTTEATQAGDRVFLAGDYTFWTSALMPYGMAAAAASGRVAAGRARAVVKAQR